MENSPENKAKFFALYWGVKALYVGGVGIETVGYGGWNLKHPDFHLELKTLSQITDEDAVEVATILNYEGCSIGRNAVAIRIKPSNFSHVEINLEFDCEISLVDTSSLMWKKLPPPSYFIQQTIDLLRSKGYALPWMGISVGEQIEWGWVKLK